MKNNNLRKERQRLRQLENRRFILEAAEKIFAQKGFSSATMDDIAEEVQFAKATIYRYFRSKNDIFLEIIYSTFDESHINIANIHKKSLSAQEKIRAIIQYIISFYYQKKNIARIFLMEKPALKKIMVKSSGPHSSDLLIHPPIPSRFKTKMKQISDIISEVIKDGVESGEFREVDVQDAAFVLGAMIRGFYFRGPLRVKEFTLQETTDLLYSYFLYGIKKPQKS